MAGADRPLLAITLGDPSGIGPEVVARALSEERVYEIARPVVVGALGPMRRGIADTGVGFRARPIETVEGAGEEFGVIDVLNVDGFEDAEFPLGELSPVSGKAAHAWIERAVRLCQDGSADAMVTAPVNKEALRLAGSEDLGHQEVFKRMSGSDYVATMLVSGSLRCMHLSTHRSLIRAAQYATRANILMATRLTDETFKRWGFENPRIAVAALNPHGGENGMIGDEEITDIRPAVEDARAEGIDANGPIPADTVFNQAIAGRWDVVVVMYHDQGHIPIKVHGFEESVSVNLGIPWIRTSVDHGTAFDIAGKGIAQAVSMREAIKLATQLATGVRPA
ncbi:MAG: 4-hydroxythreonine-4-phosphate dehydrogenase PdxA [Chloroflexi bacterium]|nr:4-hydroxythreonine-4-phosphate dehydrogenase PdxA [Chloroflexota bacterium]MCH8235672.1 4-hydroxythreonine-4-phosphate dehydrogenase PdxA [Chloroflexota bacterium]MCH8818484.1 4-hydroxythreonine-4-phosphate dehydrogenase PdxA [Chloroflexota bacterium]